MPRIGSRVLSFTSEGLVCALRNAGLKLPEDLRIVSARTNWGGMVHLKGLSCDWDGPAEGAESPWLSDRPLGVLEVQRMCEAVTAGKPA